MTFELNSDEFLEGLSEAVAKGDSALLEACVQRFAVFCFKNSSPQEDAFPDVVFSQLLTLMPKREFLEMDGSHNLLLLFEYDWARLSEQQKKNLLEFIEMSYGQFKDWMSHFVISELLGEYFCNEDSFRVLTRLQTTSNENARSLIPHGFEHIVRDAESVDLRKRALSRLNSMKSDESPQVREEVAEAIAKVSI